MKTNNLITMSILAMIINIGLFCGAVFFVLWALKYFGVIGG